MHSSKRQAFQAVEEVLPVAPLVALLEVVVEGVVHHLDLEGVGVVEEVHLLDLVVEVEEEGEHLQVQVEEEEEGVQHHQVQ